VTYKTNLTGKLSMRGAFEFKNAAGEVIKTIEFSGAVPLDRGAEQQQQEQLEREHDDHRE
jgi:hypothetical protein